MLSKVISFIVAAVVIFGIYKYFNGDIGVALTTVGDFLWQIVNTGSDWFSQILAKVF